MGRDGLGIRIAISIITTAYLAAFIYIRITSGTASPDMAFPLATALYEKCDKAIARETKKLQTDLLSPSRLAAAKKQFMGQMAISSDNGEAQCLAMGKSLMAYGRVLSDECTREKIESVTAEEIRDAARAVFNESSICRLVFM